MKTPEFWKSENLLAGILTPLGLIYGLATALRFRFKKSRKISCPVICIGNLTAGGTGKTPVSVSIAGLLQKNGRQPFFVTRGYGGKSQNIFADAKKYNVRETGDEALLLARQAPTVINSDRKAGAELAIKHGADTIIMDDGFQNPGLYKDLSFLVFDGTAGIGNGKCIPAGPLRETFTAGIKRAQAIIILGEDKHNLSARTTNLPVFRGRIKALSPKIVPQNVIAFAGIGRPQKFYDSLQELGFSLIKTFDFGDHHFYTEDELQNLLHEAHYFNAELFTTAKDFVKIPKKLQKHFNVLEITIEWEDTQGLADFILKRINAPKINENG